MSKNSYELSKENDDSVKLEDYNPSYSSELNSIKNRNYIKYAFILNIKTNILIIILFIGLFISEFYFREPLFDKSITFEEKWQDKSSDSTIKFFKFITKVGGEYLTAVPVSFVLVFYTLIQSSFYIAGFLFILHFHSLMKIWYGSSRPFWENTKLYKGIADGGFGNPSGHTITTIYLHLTLFFYLRETFLNKKYKYQIIILLFFIIFIILVILSRIILGIHSLNQVLYGSGLGIFSSLLITHILKLHQMPMLFYKKLFKDKVIIFCISGILSLLILLSILSCLFFNSNFNEDRYDQILKELTDLPKYRKFNLDGLFGSFAAVAILGMYLGQVIFWYFIDKSYKANKENKSGTKIDFIINDNDNDNAELKGIEKEYFEEDDNNGLIDNLINNWNKNRSFKLCSLFRFIKLIFIAIICFSPLIFFLIIPKDINTVLIFIFKFGIPFFFTLFFTYSFGFFYLIKIFCGEKEDLLKRVNDKIRYNNNIV